MKRKKSVAVEPEVIKAEYSPKKELLRVHEAASILESDEKAVYLWIAHGLLEYESVNGVLWITKSSVDNFPIVKGN
jgi:hypothetical protein